MGKRKAKKKSNSVNKTNSYLSRYQVKFARRRAGTFFDFRHAFEKGGLATRKKDAHLARERWRERTGNLDATRRARLGMDFFARCERSRARRFVVSARTSAFFERAFFVVFPFGLSGRRAYHSSFSLVVTKQQVKPITKLAVHSSLKTRTSTTPRSTDLSSDSRTNASFARLSTPPSRAM